MQAKTLRRALVVSFAVAAIVVAATAASVRIGTPMVAVATGETVNGVPVYRLPPVTVTASRHVSENDQ